MTAATPIPLAAAILAATVGVALILFIIGQYARELVRRRRLLAEFEELQAFDDDLRRYLQRVFLLHADWRPRLQPEDASRADAILADALTRAQAVREGRKENGDVSDDIAAMLALEDELEAVLISR